MLVPIVWFEESALIPEESAQKFRSLYIDRVRLLNWSLMSLLIASIVLLVIDTRLLITTRYWRQFKLIQVPGFNSGSSGTSGSYGDTNNGQEAQCAKSITPVAPTGMAGKKASKFQPLSALVKLTSSCGGGGDNNNKATDALGACPLTRASATKRQVGANLPLLNHNSSSYTSSSSSSVSSTASSYTFGSTETRASLASSPGSPELSKWSDDWKHRQRQQPTRVYLNHSQQSKTTGGHGNLAVASNQDQDRLRPVASMKHRSVVELSSPARRQALNSAGAPEAFDGAIAATVGAAKTTTIDASESDNNR